MSRDREAWEEGPCDPEDWDEDLARREGEIEAVFARARAEAIPQAWWEWPAVILLAIAVLVAGGLLMALIPDSWYLSDHWPL